MPEECSLLEVALFICARLSVLCHVMKERNDWSYAGRGIEDLAGTLERLPFNDAQGALVHRTLDPLVKLGTYTSHDKTIVERWMQPIVNALEKVPGKKVEVTS